ncbi:cupredoxin domain-containing protein [Pantanalinema sp. GBBB05]|uniref:cupredoxin domain-containing protein n=1 Tax=Pantanalinema sp. GBBB05 TaxID=2604139 RepID=UPI001D84E54D|nr:biphenyl 2,3-dioxygenase [Pantanalinema sp. GBBB05]
MQSLIVLIHDWAQWHFGLCLRQLILPTIIVWFGWSSIPAIAAPLVIDLSRQPAIEVQVSLGNTTNELRFVPDHLEFLAGQRYKLVLTNPSNSKHYFTAKDFADGIWTQKVEAGNVEVKGAIHEVELKPQAQAEWMFVPIKPGSYELHCSVPGHTEAGMTGTVQVTADLKAAISNQT